MSEIYEYVPGELPDVQQEAPEIPYPIQHVGIRNIRVPFMLEGKDGRMHDLVAKASVGTSLCVGNRGLSMSRLHTKLADYLNKPLKHKLLNEILLAITKDQNQTNAHIEFNFELPMERFSPLTSHKFPIYYDCGFTGYLQNDKFTFFQRVIVQYASYCPCSAALVRNLEEQGRKGFPHAQRSFAHVTTRIDLDHYVWLEDIIECVEHAVHTLPYPIIKRSDEQAIAEMAAKHPMFVEDAVRRISKSIDELPGVSDWSIKCIHEESIHTSEVVAVHWKGLDDGLRDIDI